MPFSDTGLVVRYGIAEAASGSSPGAVTDIGGVGSAFDLTLNYGGGTLAYREDSGQRGLESTNTTGNQRAAGAINNTSDKVRNALHGAQKAVIEIVADIHNFDNNGSRIFGVQNRAGGNGVFILAGTVPGTHTLQLRLNNTVVRSYAPGDLDVLGRSVYHVVVDTTQGTEANRALLYIDGVATAWTSTATITQNATISVDSNSDVIAFNRESSGSFGRAFDGVLYYAAIYTGDFDATRVADHATALLADDDAPSAGGGEEESEADFAEQETLGADATVLVFSTAAFTEQEHLPEPPDTYLYVDSPAAFEEQELFAATLPSEIESEGEFGEEETLSVGALVRVFSSVDYAQDETVAGDVDHVAVHGDANFAENETIAADAGVTVEAVAAFTENELLDVDAALEGVTPVESEASFAQRETLAVSATARIFSTAAFVEDERFATQEDEPPTDSIRWSDVDALPVLRLTAAYAPVLQITLEGPMEWNPGSSNMLRVLLRSNAGRGEKVEGATVTATVENESGPVSGMTQPMEFTEVRRGVYEAYASENADITADEELTATIVADADGYHAEGEVTITVAAPVLA